MPHSSEAIPTPGNHYRLILHVSQQQHETVTANAPTGKSTLKMAKLSKKSLRTILKQPKNTYPAPPPLLLGLLESTFVLSITLITVHNLKPK